MNEFENRCYDPLGLFFSNVIDFIKLLNYSIPHFVTCYQDLLFQENETSNNSFGAAQNNGKSTFGFVRLVKCRNDAQRSRY